jgi:FKBP-type peptidyl-prolyl cis-trans isomerase FkpA
MKKQFLIIAAAALGFAACKGGLKKGPAGLEYTIVEDAKGDSIKVGDFISLNIIAKTDGDSVLYNSYETGRQSQTLVPKSVYPGDLFYAIMKLTKGDSAIIKINIDSAEKKGQPRPPGIKGKYIVYNLKIMEVIKKDTSKEQEFQAKINAFFKAEGDKEKGAEAGKIKKYIDDNKLKVVKLPSGLQIATKVEGSGDKINVGDSVMLNYTGKLTSGKVFDTSIAEVAKANKTFNPQRPYSTLNMLIGMGKVIKGFDEGVMQMKKGGKAILIIPSDLAYGEQGMQGGLIGPYSPLVFEIDLVKVIPGKVKAPVVPTKLGK